MTGKEESASSTSNKHCPFLWELGKAAGASWNMVQSSCFVNCILDNKGKHLPWCTLLVISPFLALNSETSWMLLVWYSFMFVFISLCILVSCWSSIATMLLSLPVAWGCLEAHCYHTTWCQWFISASCLQKDLGWYELYYLNDCRIFA